MWESRFHNLYFCFLLRGNLSCTWHCDIMRQIILIYWNFIAQWTDDNETDAEFLNTKQSCINDLLLLSKRFAIMSNEKKRFIFKIMKNIFAYDDMYIKYVITILFCFYLFNIRFFHVIFRVKIFNHLRFSAMRICS